MSVTKSRKGIIEFLRFIFAFIVLMVHSHGFNPPPNYPFCGGYLGVEFFLILTGYFMTNKCHLCRDRKEPGKVAVSITKKMFHKLVPFIAIVVMIHYIIAFAFHDVALHDLPYAVYEILLLPMSGIYKTFLIWSLWYLSAVIICLLPWSYLLIRYNDFFENIGSVLFPILIYGYICRMSGHLDTWDVWNGIYIGILRVFAGLCMGTNCHKISDLIRKKEMKLGQRNVFYIAACFVIILVVCYIFKFAFTSADFFLCLLLTCALAVLLGVETKFDRIFNNQFFYFLGEWSIALYCGHWTVRYALMKLYGNQTYDRVVPVYIGLSLTYSLILILVIKCGKKVRNRLADNK